MVGLVLPDRLWRPVDACGTLGGGSATGRLGEELLLMEQLTQENEMSKIMRVCVLVVSLMSLFGAMSSSAGAVTWSNDGGSTFVAAGGPGTLSGGALSLLCLSSDLTGTVGTNPHAGTIWKAASGTLRFTNCNISGVPTNAHCTYTLTATGQSVSSVTNGDVDLTCDLTQDPATKVCHIHGSTPGHYINPPDARLILTESSSLRTTSVPPGNCPLGNGGATTLSPQTFTITSAIPPILTRRP
jgi:hypothetical protein